MNEVNVRNPAINEEQLIADLRQQGEYFIAVNLGDLVRRLNEEEDVKLQPYDANRLTEYGNEFKQSQQPRTRDIGARLIKFVETHKR